MEDEYSLWRSKSYVPKPTESKLKATVTMPDEQESNGEECSRVLPDFSDMDEVRKAFVMSELLNRKY